MRDVVVVDGGSLGSALGRALVDIFKDSGEFQVVEPTGHGRYYFETEEFSEGSLEDLYPPTVYGWRQCRKFNNIFKSDDLFWDFRKQYKTASPDERKKLIKEFKRTVRKNRWNRYLPITRMHDYIRFL